eukprot:2651839-Prymnesium_polylepis.1
MSGRTATWKQPVHSTRGPFDVGAGQCGARSHGLPKSHVWRSAILKVCGRRVFPEETRRKRLAASLGGSDL